MQKYTKSVYLGDSRRFKNLLVFPLCPLESFGAPLTSCNLNRYINILFSITNFGIIMKFKTLDNHAYITQPIEFEKD